MTVTSGPRNTPAPAPPWRRADGRAAVRHEPWKRPPSHDRRAQTRYTTQSDLTPFDAAVRINCNIVEVNSTVGLARGEAAGWLPGLDALDWAPAFDSESHVEHDAAVCHASDGVE